MKYESKMKCEACGVNSLTAILTTEFPGGGKIHSCSACFRILQAMYELVIPEVEIPD